MQRRTLEILDRQTWLDPITERISSAVAPALSPGRVRTVLSGSWLGHRLHPLMTDVTVGSLVSATLLDLLAPAEEHGADRLAAIGLASSLPTIASGLNDWYDVGGSAQPIRRVGIVHATSNAIGLSFFVARALARRRGDVGRARLLSVMGVTALSVGGYLGGHLTYIQGAGVDRTAFDPPVEDWKPALPIAELPERELRAVDIEGRPVLLYREDAALYALDDTCTHYGCSLAEGRVEDGSVVCACHGSTFRLRDGSIVRGPAATPQAAYATRVVGGVVELRPA